MSRLPDSVRTVRAALDDLLTAYAGFRPGFGADEPPRDEVSVWCDSMPAVDAVVALAPGFCVHALLDGAVVPFRVRVSGAADDLDEFVAQLLTLPVRPLSVSR